ncbi:DNA mismatch repair protein [Tanacetum coccineum]
MVWLLWFPTWVFGEKTKSRWELCRFGTVLALKHHTSKLSDFPDFQSLTTFGFREEALSALCNLGDLTVETRTKNEKVATHLTFDRSGSLTDEKKTARQVGTTVTVKSLFSNLPVRCKEFHRNIRKEYGKLISLLQAYALIAKGVRLVCTNTIGKNKNSGVLKTQGSGYLKDNIITMFGMNTFNCLEPVNLYISDTCQVDGFLSKSGYGSGRNIGDRQYYFVNGRPVDMPKVSKLVNELYRSANSKQYPIAIMNFAVPTNIYSPNLASFSVQKSENLASFSVQKSEGLSQEGKNSICCSQNEESFLQFSLKQVSTNASDSKKEASGEKQPQETLKSSPDVNLVDVEDYSISKKDFTLKAHSVKKDDTFSGSYSRKNTTISNKSSYNQQVSSYNSTVQKNVVEGTDLPHSGGRVQSLLTSFVTVNKRKHESIGNTLSEVPILRNGPTLLQSVTKNLNAHFKLAKSPVNHHVVCGSDEVDWNESKPLKRTLMDEDYDVLDVSPLKVVKDSGKFDEDPITIEKPAPVSKSVLDPTSPEKTSDALEVIDISTPPNSSQPALDAPDPSHPKMCYTLWFSFEELKKKRQQKLSAFQASKSTPRFSLTKGCYADATLEHSQVVIGQFNLGFIIGKLDQDLFIVDQVLRLYHLSILNLTVGQNGHCLGGVELSPEEEVIVSMHMDTIRKNGFSLEEDVNATPGHRYRLKAVPFSKNITFGVSDVKELISILADSEGECSMMGTYKMDTADSVCPPRVRAMLASRACRSSVMIGDPLGRNEMQKIVAHLRGLRSPWNCPHGRPTMRHLVDLTTVHKQYKYTDEDDSAL